MQLHRVSVTFPGERSEVHYLAHVPAVGDTFRGHGQDWIVETVDHENSHALVTLRASDRD